MQKPLEEARRALELYRRLVDQAQDLEHEDLAKAIRQLVAVRDQLVAERRLANDWSARQQEDLDRVNSMLSVSSAAEFPLVGVRWERLCLLRDSLSQLIAGWDRGTTETTGKQDKHMAGT